MYGGSRVCVHLCLICLLFRPNLFVKHGYVQDQFMQSVIVGGAEFENVGPQKKQ